MRLSLSESELAGYIVYQLNRSFPDRRVLVRQVATYLIHALERAEHCFARITNKYFSQDGQACFNHLHTDQYAMLLYLLGHTIHRMGGNPALATKTYALNKALHAIDLLYEVELPEVFYFQHPLGTVLGRAHYGNYFAVYQRCTVGGNPELQYPTLGTGVVLYAGSAVIGKCQVGDNCALSADTTVIDQDLPANGIVFGHSPGVVARRAERNVVAHLFRM